LGDFEGARQLENKVAAAKPALLENNALIFGAARILGGDAASAAGFFLARLEKGKGGKFPRGVDPEWLRWYYGFSLAIAKFFDKAQAVFAELAADAEDPLASGLSAFFLSEVLGKPDLAVEGADRARKAVKNIEGWKKRAAKLEAEVHGAIIRKHIDEAGMWLFKER
jgi:hypothetical protein